MAEELKKIIQEERRRYQRIRKDFKIRLRKFVFPVPSDDSWQIGIIENLSAGGILVTLENDALDQKFEVGNTLHMELEIGKWNEIKATDKPFDYFYHREPFTVLGKIIRFETDSRKQIVVGIDFVGVDESQRTSVFRYIQKLLSK
ncbi:MAG: PilZ domain-containing protein [Candidatus Aureabacteria bacterium]|nr:PilZ domain-containing protein [Candidatus Auribacterota bacterium]